MMTFETRLRCWHLLLAAVLPFGASAADGAPNQSHASIRAQAQQFLMAQLEPEQRQDAQIELGRMDPRLRLRQCSVPLQAFAVGTRAKVGATSVGVRCDGDHPWTLYLSARVTVFGEVVVAARALGRGDAVQRGDLQLVRKDLSKLPYGYLIQTDQANGKILKRNYTAGQVIQPNQLAAPLLVKRGQQVTLHAESGGIEIHMGGRALSDGAEGDRIRVRNSSSQRVVEGEVVAQGVVRVRI